jgi:hypothetical protein
MNVLKGECVLCLSPHSKCFFLGFACTKKTDFTIYTFHDHLDLPLKSFSLIILFLLLNKVGRKEVPHVTYSEHTWT